MEKLQKNIQTATPAPAIQNAGLIFKKPTHSLFKTVFPSKEVVAVCSYRLTCQTI
jgi:hypothetical protein